MDLVQGLFILFLHLLSLELLEQLRVFLDHGCQLFLLVHGAHSSAASLLLFLETSGWQPVLLNSRFSSAGTLLLLSSTLCGVLHQLVLICLQLVGIHLLHVRFLHLLLLHGLVLLHSL